MRPRPTLRRATADDLPAALQLIEDVMRDSFLSFASQAEIEAAVVAKRAPGESGHYFDGSGVLLLASHAGALVGCLGIQFHRRYAILDNGFCSVRRAGVGRALLAAGVDDARGRGCFYMLAEVYAANPAGRGYLGAHGFAPAGLRRPSHIMPSQVVELWGRVL